MVFPEQTLPNRPAVSSSSAQASQSTDVYDVMTTRASAAGKVLLLAYDFPPSRSVGSVRSSGMAKYLPEFGWEPIVVTPQRPCSDRRAKARVIETADRDVLAEWKSKLHLNTGVGLHEQLGLSTSSRTRVRLPHTMAINFLKSILMYPDPMKGWPPFALSAVADVLNTERVDAVFTTSPPFSCHVAGAQVKRKFGLPWIADVRDIWDCDFFRRRLENKTLVDADALLAVSLPSADILRKRYPTKQVATVTNGFDPDVARPTDNVLTRRFSITHTGQLYEGKRDPSLLLQTLAELVREGGIVRSDLQLRFYGPSEPFLLSLARIHGLESVTEIHDTVPREEVLRHQRESQLLLLLCWSNTRDSACFTIPAKLFEYMGSRRPVLSLGIERGGIAEILQRTNSGRHIDAKTALREFLLGSYAQFKANGRVLYGGQDEAIGGYTQIEMARKVAAVLSCVTRGTSHANR
jgi:hypothetical protein